MTTYMCPTCRLSLAHTFDGGMICGKCGGRFEKAKPIEPKVEVKRKRGSIDESGERLA